MSAEETVRALLHSAAAALRLELRDATVDALAEDFSGAFRRLLRQAYDVGFREGIASARARAGRDEAGGTPSTAMDAETAPATQTETTLDDAGSSPYTSDPEVESGSTDEDDDREPEDAPPSRPLVQWSESQGEARRQRDEPSGRIFPHATIGTLLDRIYSYFELDRFDIDVVITRKGDRSRRQLKRTVKLSKYLVGE